MEYCKNELSEVLVSESEIKDICKNLGEQITKDYKDLRPIIVGVLKGSVVFMADLMRNIACDCEIDFMAVSSYQGAKSSGTVTFKMDLDRDIAGRHIIIAEDILDTGATLAKIKDILLHRNAASVKICAFLDKPANRKADISADYVGKVIPDEFVIGYGLDYNEKYRNLPFVGILSPKVYADN